MEKFFDYVLQYIDFVVVAIVLCSGFFQQLYLKGFTLSKTNDSALKTLAVSFVASCAYILLIKAGDAKNWAMYFLSYFFATSLYELLINPFVKWIKSKTGQDLQEKPPTIVQ